VSAATVAGRRRVSPRRAAARAVRRLSPRLKRRLIALALACLALAAGYQFWLRDSSLVAVEHVEVTGVTSSDAARVRAAITSAARDMTTLHVDREALDRAVAGYPVVRKLEVAPDFPHGLSVHVIEYEPAAIAVSDAGHVPVAGDGTILRGVAVKGNLPTVDVDGALGTAFLLDRTARGAAAVAGGAPAVLRARIEDVQRRSDDGYVAELRDGPELIFGAATRLRAKWAAAARVLADLEARGATYVDLRIPSRPAVGGLAATTVPDPSLPPCRRQARSRPKARNRLFRTPCRRTRRHRRPHRRRRPPRRPSRRPPQPPWTRSQPVPEAARPPLRKASSTT
jgi:cell division protein FtsQ